MSLSIVIPARDAGATIGKTIAGLLDQTSREWEAIVVDDGSTDGTAETARAAAGGDPRVRVLMQDHRGEGAARNAGIRVARFDWLLFLDADDWILPAFVERTSAMRTADPALGAICTGWARAAPDGTLSEESYRPDYARLFPVLARFCPFAIHSCVVRRALVEEVGGFDESLAVGADWDLWQRIARTGARFGRVDETLACYRMRPGSVVTNVRVLLANGLRLIALGHDVDPRVQRPDPAYAQGVPRNGLAEARFAFACWPAGMLLGTGRDARWILESLGGDRAPDLDAGDVAISLFKSALLAHALVPRQWVELWPAVEHAVYAFLAELETSSGGRQLAARARRELERLVLDQVPTSGGLTIGRTSVIRVEITEPVPDVTAPVGVDRLRCHVAVEGEVVGWLELPICDGFVPGALLADAIVADLAWTILGRFFERTIYPHLEIARDGEVTTISRDAVILAAEVLDEAALRLPGKLHEVVGWKVMLQEVWGRPDLDPTEVQDALAPASEPLRAEAGPEAAAPQRTVEISVDLTDLELPPGPIAVTVTAAGAPITALTIEAPGGQLPAMQLRRAVTAAAGVELLRVTVREALLGQPFSSGLRIRDRLARRVNGEGSAAAEVAVARVGDVAIPASPAWGGAIARTIGGRPSVVFGRRSAPDGTSASRRAALPTAALDHLRDAARQAGELVLNVTGHDPRIASYLPDVIAPSHPHGLSSRPPAATDGAPNDDAAAVACAKVLPILMYHQVAPAGPAALARYRVAPDAFEAQLRHLRDTGYRSVSLDEWREAKHRGRPLARRGVLLTFDDGYRDFAEFAWPLLERYGFTATVFLVTNHIGRTNSWVPGEGGGSPLLDWREIRRLRDSGVEFGSHSATHPYLTGLSPAAVAAEAARSRSVLDRELGLRVTSFAYPHGAEDGAVQRLVGGCGYLYGLSCRPGPSGLHDPLLALPRIEVTGFDTLTTFAAKLEG